MPFTFRDSIIAQSGPTRPASVPLASRYALEGAVAASSIDTPGLFQKPDGTVWLRDAEGNEAQVGSGGSQPGAVYKTDVVFNEPAGPHADLVATVPVADNETVREIELIPVVGPWADGTDAGITVGDSDDPHGYYDNDSNFQLGQYDPANATAGTNYDFVQYGGSTYLKVGLLGSGSSPGGVGKLYPVADTLTMTLGGISTGGGGGQLLVRVWKMAASTPIVAA